MSQTYEEVGTYQIDASEAIRLLASDPRLRNNGSSFRSATSPLEAGKTYQFDDVVILYKKGIDEKRGPWSQIVVECTEVQKKDRGNWDAKHLNKVKPGILQILLDNENRIKGLQVSTIATTNARAKANGTKVDASKVGVMLSKEAKEPPKEEKEDPIIVNELDEIL